MVLISFLLDSYFLSICKRLRCLFVFVVIYRGPSHLAAHWCIAPLIVVSEPIVVSDGAIDLRYATIDNSVGVGVLSNLLKPRDFYKSSYQIRYNLVTASCCFYKEVGDHVLDRERSGDLDRHLKRRIKSL